GYHLSHQGVQPLLRDCLHRGCQRDRIRRAQTCGCLNKMGRSIGTGITLARLRYWFEKRDADPATIQRTDEAESNRRQSNFDTSRRKKECMFHEVSRAVSRAIISSSFVWMTRQSKPDRDVMRPPALFPCSSLRSVSSSGCKISRCFKTRARIAALFSPIPPVKITASMDEREAVSARIERASR